MNRWGYLVMVLSVLGLGAYAFWPSSIAGDSVRVWVGERPEDFTVVDPHWPQEVRGQQVRIGGHLRAIDTMAVGHLWLLLDQLSAPKAKVKDGVPADELGAYGIDGQHGVDASDLRLRWGTVGADGYCAVGARVLSVGAEAIQQVSEVAARLDSRLVFPLADGVDHLSVDGSDYALVNGRWIDQLHPNRPGLTIHASELLSLLSHVAVDSLEGVGLRGEAAHRIAFTLPRSSERHTVVLRVDPAAVDPAQACTIQADDLPTQAVPPAVQAHWLGLIAALGRDYLLDLDGRTARAQVKAIDFQRGGHDWFSLERRNLAYRVGETSWQLSWSGGREKASEAAVARTLAALCDMSVVRAEPGPDPLPQTALMIQARLTLQDNSMMVIAVDGDRAWTANHHGVTGGLSALQRLEPSELLELAVLDATPDRIEKLQRIGSDPPLAEVLTRSEDGVWSRTHGSGPCDAVAIGRITRALTETQATAARFTTDADRAALAHCPIEVDLRLEPRAKGAPRLEIADEQDTVTQDLGYDGIQDARGAWWLVDVEGGVSYRVDRDLIDILRAPLQSDTILPLVPSLARQLLFQHGGRVDALTREGESWWWQQGNAARVAADPAQVRRYLRALAALTAVSRQPQSPLLLPAAAALIVTVVMPATPGVESLVLTISDPNGASDAAASVTSSAHGAEVPRGQVRIARDAAEDLIAVTRERFALAAAPSAQPSAHPSAQSSAQPTAQPSAAQPSARP